MNNGVYPTAYEFIKEGNLVQYAKGKNYPVVSYQAVREIHLVALFRYEGEKVFCCIKCPVNPLPIRGEFETVSEKAVVTFLVSQGWLCERKFNPFIYIR